MSLRNLTEGTMFAQLVYWLTRQRDVFLAHPALAWLIPVMQVLHDDFIALRRDPQARLDEAREAATKQDAVHDDLLRANYFLLMALEFWARDPDLKAEFRRARETLFDGGLAMVNRGYADEAAEADLVLSRIDDETRALLQAHAFADGTADTLFEAWRAEARRLGDLDAIRTEVEAEVKELRGSAYVALRTEWMKVVRAFLGSLELVPADVRRTLLARLQEAEARADARVAARRAANAARGVAPADDPSGVLPADGSEGRGEADEAVFGDVPLDDGAEEAPPAETNAASADEDPQAPVGEGPAGEDPEAPAPRVSLPR